MGVVVAIAGCSGSGDQGSSAGKKELRIVLPAAPSSLNPVPSPITNSAVYGAMVEPMLARDPDDGTPSRDGLVTDWEQTAPTTWRFTLRDGVKFHDGEPLDSAAIVFTINEYKNNPKSLGKGILSTVVGVTAIDPLTFEVTTSVPNNATPALLTRLTVLPPTYYQKQGADGFAAKPVGTGPFQFDSAKAGQQVKVVAFPGYWRGKPSLDGIVFTFSPDANARLSLLQSGAVDVAGDLPIQLYDQVTSDTSLQLLKTESSAQMTAFIKDTTAPLDDPKLREAVVRAIDTDSIVKAIFADGAGAQVAPGMLSPLMSTPTDVAGRTGYDLAKAKALVAPHGHPTITLSYSVGKYPNDKQVGEAVGNMLEQAGFTVKRNTTDSVGIAKALNDKATPGVVLYQISPTYPHPDVFARVFANAETATPKTCHDPRTADLTARGIAARDSAESDQIYGEYEDLILNQLYCFKPMYFVVRAFAATTHVHHLTTPKNLIPDYYPVTLG